MNSFVRVYSCDGVQVYDMSNASSSLWKFIGFQQLGFFYEMGLRTNDRLVRIRGNSGLTYTSWYSLTSLSGMLNPYATLSTYSILQIDITRGLRRTR